MTIQVTVLYQKPFVRHKFNLFCVFVTNGYNGETLYLTSKYRHMCNSFRNSSDVKVKF